MIHSLGATSGLQRCPGRDEPDPHRPRVDSSAGPASPSDSLGTAHPRARRRHHLVARAHGRGRGQHTAQQLQAQHGQGRLQGPRERRRLGGLHERRKSGGFGRADRRDVAGGRGGEKR